MKSKDPGKAPVSSSEKDHAQQAQEIGKLPEQNTHKEDDLQPLKEKSGF